MVRLRWKKDISTGATLMVTIGNEGAMEGSKLAVRGSMGDMKIRVSTLWGVDTVNHDVEVKIGDLSDFSFHHEGPGVIPVI